MSGDPQRGDCPVSGEGALAGDGAGSAASLAAAAGRVYARLIPRVPKSLREEAEAFLDLLALEPGGPGVSAARRAEVLRDIDRHGMYEHTPDELLWGCRFAWRHSVRCVGRFFWKQLEVRDARQCASAEDVAAACVAHVRDATNGGAIRPLVTVFAPKRAGVESWRIWNYELVRYAGYRSEDGEVLGDPAEAEFTQKCIDLGWRPPSTRSAFDPLPILLSGPGAPLHCFELPREEVLEVPLVHPEFEWFRDLDLRWYAVPIVSNMRLEIGGIEYTAAPFNGWYMGTEIGARNLADLGRYNLLPEVAARMGILQKREASLWRDRALVELNRAVLHSFQLAGVRMVDHHTVSELHLRFEEQEAAAGRPVTGRWDWLIPPLSGATSPLWNRAYDPCEYSPNFYTQPCEMPGAAGGFECA